MRKNPAPPLNVPAALIDTGTIVAIVDSSDDWHVPCLNALRSLRFPILTTEAVLTEAFHLVGRNTSNIEKLWQFVSSGGITLCNMSDSDLPQLHALMRQYSDRPMDFADATLVHLAARERISTIFTIDHDDFSTYRLPGRKKFTIFPTPPRQ
ncbi:MAG TPA: PIN domain-containing protein [Candidatus Sulfotelmatobacter sp.]|nr:PIN domain-containing protein [Candidatus Sulfotelmatobacter sp.]